MNQFGIKAQHFHCVLLGEKPACVICLVCSPLSLLGASGDYLMDSTLAVPVGRTTHPADGHHVVAHQHSSHKLGLDALSQQDLLEVRQARLVDEHRLMPWNLEGGRERERQSDGGLSELLICPCGQTLVEYHYNAFSIRVPWLSVQ